MDPCFLQNFAQLLLSIAVDDCRHRLGRGRSKEVVNRNIFSRSFVSAGRCHRRLIVCLHAAPDLQPFRRRGTQRLQPGDQFGEIRIEDLEFIPAHDFDADDLPPCARGRAVAAFINVAGDFFPTVTLPLVEHPHGRSLARTLDPRSSASAIGRRKTSCSRFRDVWRQAFCASATSSATAAISV